MPLTTRYGFADAPSSAIIGDGSLAWTTSTGVLLAAGTSLPVVSSGAFPAALEFDVIIGVRDPATGVWANAEVRHVTVVSGTTWTVSAGTLDHVSGSDISHVLTATALTHNPGALTDTGDLPYLLSTGRMGRLAAPADGTYALTWASGVPSWSAASGGISFADLATPPTATALGSSGAPFGSLTAAGPLVISASAATDSLDVLIGEIDGTNPLVSQAEIRATFTTPQDLAFTGYGLFNAAATIRATVNPAVDEPNYNVYAGSLTVLDVPATSSHVFYEAHAAMAIASYQGSANPNLQIDGSTIAVSATTQVYSLVGVSGVATTTADAQTLLGVNFGVAAHGTAQIGTMYGAYIATRLTDTAHSALVYGVYVNPTAAGSGTADTYLGVWVTDAATIATNSYAFWSDTRGVFRIKADSTFDAVAQSIPALYNPQFTKYTPGATDYERIVLGQWHGNIAEIGTEKGGTGTLRAVKILGASLDTPATLTMNGAAVATQTYVTAQGFTTPGAVVTYVTGLGYTTLAAVAGVGYVPGTRTVNGHALSANVTVTAADLSLGSVENAAASGLYVPLTRTVNGHALSGNVSVTASDLSLGSVENTALSTWAGSTNLVTLGAAAATSLATSAASPLLLTNGKLVTIALTAQTVNPATLTIPNFASVSDTFAFTTLAQTFTNKRITKRVVTASDATSITPNSDNAEITYQLNTQATGTLTINADGGTPTNGQSWLLKIKSTNVQTFAWNSLFVGGTIALPTATSAASKIDYFSFIYDTVNTKWHYVGSAAGF